jgi:hypothetical protein
MEIINEDNLSNTIRVMYHTESQLLEGNMGYISLEHILCITYDQLLKLDINFTKSLSYKNCNILIEGFPIITYGVNYVKQNSIHLFLKRLTDIDRHFNEYIDKNIKNESMNLERILFNDLQLFLNYYNYLLKHEQTSYLKSLMRFLYQPIKSFLTYKNDCMIINEIHKAFSINTKEEVFIIKI